MNLGPLIESKPDGYVPDADELAQMEEIERSQRECKSSHAGKDIGEDGCLDCGYGSK